jgi:hypothetical protein
MGSHWRAPNSAGAFSSPIEAPATRAGPLAKGVNQARRCSPVDGHVRSARSNRAPKFVRPPNSYSLLPFMYFSGPGSGLVFVLVTIGGRRIIPHRQFLSPSRTSRRGSGPRFLFPPDSSSIYDGPGSQQLQIVQSRGPYFGSFPIRPSQAIQ